MGVSPLFCCWRQQVKEEIIGKITAIAERVAAREGVELVEVQLLGGGNSRLLRIFIDRTGGVTHGDCENMSHQVGTILDIEDVIPGGSYTLEVSSPGVERKLVKPGDFERFAGKKARLVLHTPIENSKHLTGTLGGLDGGAIRIELEKGGSLLIPFEQVAKANLKFDW